MLFQILLPFKKMLISAKWRWGGGNNGEINKVMMAVINLINLSDLKK